MRYFNVAGADPQGRTGQSTAGATHLIKVACEAALGKRPGLSVFGTDYETRDGTCVRDYIHVTDLVRAHMLALNHLAANGDSLTLNCGYGQGYSVLAAAERIRKQLHWAPDYDDLDIIVTQALAWERGLAARRAA